MSKYRHYVSGCFCKRNSCKWEIMVTFHKIKAMKLKDLLFQLNKGVGLIMQIKT